MFKKPAPGPRKMLMDVSDMNIYQLGELTMQFNTHKLEDPPENTVNQI